MTPQGPHGLVPIFRENWPKLIATLVRDFRDLDIAEDAAQDAFIEASERWGRDGTPDQPAAWLLTVARRKAIDRLRKLGREAARTVRLQDEIHEPRVAESTEPEHASDDSFFLDDQLALLLGCCHPALNLDAQVALTLRCVAGLSSGQIAKAFLVPEQTMVRRITRAKTKIREAGIPFSLPERSQLDERIGSVTQVIYLIFNEGHTSTVSTSLIRGDLCDEAIWLSGLLTRLAPTDPEVHGLAALVSLTDSRRLARVDKKGEAILLEDQDRSRWDHTKIAAGLAHLAQAHALQHLGPYQIQAAIQALHASSESFDDTNWRSIVSLYDLLLVHQPSAVIALNRAVANSYATDAQTALASLVGLDEALDSYVYFHSTRAELLQRSGQLVEAKVAFTRAIEQSDNEVERRHFAKRRDACRRE